MPQPRQPESSGTQSEPREGEALPAPPEELGYSRDATHSTYSVLSAEHLDAQANNPPAGQIVEQKLGKPSEASE